MNINMDDIEQYLRKWQKNLRLQDWDIKIQTVEKEWNKTGDIKIDDNDRIAILLINVFNPKQTNLEQLIIHELLHLKLWGMDQMLENLVNNLYSSKDDAPKRNVVYSQYMTILESTVNDLAKSFLEQGGNDKTVSYGRLENEIRNKLEE